MKPSGWRDQILARTLGILLRLASPEYREGLSRLIARGIEEEMADMKLEAIVGKSPLGGPHD